jgi:hypothetical protein
MYFGAHLVVRYGLDRYPRSDSAGKHLERKCRRSITGRCSHQGKGTLMKPQVRRLRLHKSTLRDVSPQIAQEVVGGSIEFTDTCTYASCHCTEACPCTKGQYTCAYTCVQTIGPSCEPTDAC